MIEHLSSHADRAWQRRNALAGALTATVGYALLAGLSLGWALSGFLAAGAWAALWPARGVGDAAGSGLFDAAAQDGLSGAPAERTIPAALLEGLADPALVINARGDVVIGNASAHTIAPLPIGRPLSAWNRSPELLAAVGKAMTAGAQQRCNVRLFSPVERSLDVRITPDPGPPGGAPGLALIVLRDLTEQESLTRMRADFVANASHELRTPLASLRGFIETLQGAAKDDLAARTRFLGIMQTQAERMSRLIEDLLSLSRIEMREHVAPTASVDLAALVSDIIGSLKPLAEQSQITLRAALGDEAISAVGDRDELAQVVQNLLQNAIKYGRSGGKVDIAIRRESAQVVIEVADDGIGIAPEHLPRLTERFYRVSAKDSKERGGTGLGLAIVKHIVNRHRGELRIASLPGKGSTFGVVLPAARGTP